MSTTDIWAQLAAPLDPKDISWRIDSKPVFRDNKYIARFVCYVEAGTVRERLDSVVPGEWDLTLDVLPLCVAHEGSATLMAFKARLQVRGVIREDVGQGDDYKQAATDAFKRVAVRVGIGHELYAMEMNWVEVDGDGKNAKPVEDPQQAYERRYGSGKQNPRPTAPSTPRSTSTSAAPSAARTTGRQAEGSATSDDPSCPKCGGRVWDNRLTKKNPKAPDYKCRDKSCDGCIWPLREDQQQDAFGDNMPPEDDGWSDALASGY